MTSPDAELMIKCPGSPGSQQKSQVWPGSDIRASGGPGLEELSADRCDRSALVPNEPIGVPMSKIDPNAPGCRELAER